MVDDRDPLISAIQHGDLKKVIDLMDAEMDIDALLRGTGKAAIHWAAVGSKNFIGAMVSPIMRCYTP